MQERPENQKLIGFRERLRNVQIVTVDPWAMKPESEREESELAWDMRNFVSWYRHVRQERSRQQEPFFEDLRAVIGGFEDLPVKQAGETTRVMRLETRVAGRPCHLAWRELSEGQRVLIGLYALLHWAVGPGRTLVVDEPENFVALPEIQPWLTALFDQVTDHGAQAILVSHHPEVKDYLAVEHGLVFERQDGPTRVKAWPASDTGLRPSELSARGWEVE